MLYMWLPMNGNLEQQGCSNVIADNVNAVIDDNGKIGKCYSFNGTNQYINLQNMDLNGWPELSICCWCYPTADFKDIFLTRGGGAHRFKINATGFVFRDTNNSTQRTVALGQTIPINTWTHITCTYNRGEVYIYCNGIQTNHSTTYYHDNSTLSLDLTEYRIARAQTSSGSTYYSGKMNDFRIYNHVLSAAEVREISQGLICHYKLDDNVQTISNAFSTPYFDSNANAAGWNHWGRTGASGTFGINTDKQYMYFKDKDRNHKVANAASATGEYLVYQSPAFDGGYRSVQCIVKEQNSTPITNNVFFPAWNARDGGAESAVWTSISSLGNGFYLCKVDGIHQDGSNDLVGFYVSPGYTIYLSCAWLENNKERCSDALFYSSTVEDCSGFGHNATHLGGGVSVGESPRYSYAFAFNGNVNNRIQCNTSDFNLTDNFSFSAWIRANYTGTAGQYLFTVGRADAGSYGYGFQNTADTTLRVKFGNKNYDVTITKNTWTHIAFTKSGTAIKVYKNGTVNKNVTFDGTLPTYTECNGVGIGCFHYTGGNIYPGYGAMSDFRIYCTALDATAVKQLYELGAKVDNKGNIHGYEFVEQNGFKIHKTGVTTHKKFIEPVLLNSGPTVSYKPAANTNNSCATGVVVDFSEFAESGLPITVIAEYDVSWSNLAVGTGGSLTATVQGNNRQIADNAWVWSGSNYVTSSTIPLSGATGTTHIRKVSTIPASWLDTYNASHLGIRCNYSNGNGTLSLTNIKVTIDQDKCKIKKEYIQADEFIEL